MTKTPKPMSAWALRQRNENWLVLNSRLQEVSVTTEKSHAELIKDAVAFVRCLAEKHPELGLQENGFPEGSVSHTITELLRTSNTLGIYYARAAYEQHERHKQQAEEDRFWEDRVRQQREEKERDELARQESAKSTKAAKAAGRRTRVPDLPDPEAVEADGDHEAPVRWLE